MAILVTGGAGYIASHTILSLIEQGNEVIIIDNLSNSYYDSLLKIKEITGCDCLFYKGDILDKKLLLKIFDENNITAVMHFAGAKSVSESVIRPLQYYRNNVSGTFSLVKAMEESGVENLIFSSSATVYGEPKIIPVNESCAIGGTTNPYGTSKLFVENFLRDYSKASPNFKTIVLRYFNPIGAHSSGKIGEDPNGIPNNLMPFICQVAIGKQKTLKIYGNDYPTKDGTGIRDYIHVMDLAEGHVAALNNINQGANYRVYNLGTGIGYSVLELLEAFQKVTTRRVPYVFTKRRSGDIAECWSDPTKAYEELGWKARRGLEDMIRDAWNWQQKNPNGFKKV
ncbi:UDP-glucose 4-epimerase GalE [Escherichia coli]|uniref:UDP-glucose 4-epimerase GalE n=1 Tax=Escherichia coli TaxID=562 RepID=UPI000C1626DC|nr:UDP-glucose 4-epimerase GalE [Escherichia coli]